jgi:hypothetical protein
MEFVDFQAETTPPGSSCSICDAINEKRRTHVTFTVDHTSFQNNIKYFHYSTSFNMIDAFNMDSQQYQIKITDPADSSVTTDIKVNVIKPCN